MSGIGLEEEQVVIKKFKTEHVGHKATSAVYWLAKVGWIKGMRHYEIYSNGHFPIMEFDQKIYEVEGYSVAECHMACTSKDGKICYILRGTMIGEAVESAKSFYAELQNRYTHQRQSLLQLWDIYLPDTLNLVWDKLTPTGYVHRNDVECSWSEPIYFVETEIPEVMKPSKTWFGHSLS